MGIRQEEELVLGAFQLLISPGRREGDREIGGGGCADAAVVLGAAKEREGRESTRGKPTFFGAALECDIHRRTS